MDLPRLGIVLVVKASEGIELKNLPLPLAKSPEGMLTHSTVADTVVYTFEPTRGIGSNETGTVGVSSRRSFCVGLGFGVGQGSIRSTYAQPGGRHSGFQRLSTGMELKGQQLQFVSPRAAEMPWFEQLVSVLRQRTGNARGRIEFF